MAKKSSKKTNFLESILVTFKIIIVGIVLALGTGLIRLIVDIQSTELIILVIWGIFNLWFWGFLANRFWGWK